MVSTTRKPHAATAGAKVTTTLHRNRLRDEIPPYVTQSWVFPLRVAAGLHGPVERRFTLQRNTGNSVSWPWKDRRGGHARVATAATVRVTQRRTIRVASPIATAATPRAIRAKMRRIVPETASAETARASRAKRRRVVRVIAAAHLHKAGHSAGRGVATPRPRSVYSTPTVFGALRRIPAVPSRRGARQRRPLWVPVEARPKSYR